MATDGTPGLDRVPQIAARFRLQFEAVQSSWVLLYPEGMVRLSASAAEILRRVDGRSTVDALMQSLEASFPGADLRGDVHDFLRVAHERGWIVDA